MSKWARLPKPRGRSQKNDGAALVDVIFRRVHHELNQTGMPDEKADRPPRPLRYAYGGQDSRQDNAASNGYKHAFHVPALSFQVINLTPRITEWR